MEDKLSEKFLRKASRDQQKRLKPGECLKYIRMILDDSIPHTPYGQQLIAALNEQEQFPYVLRKLAAPYCISWERNAGQRLLDPWAASTSGGLTEEWQMEKHVIRLLTSEELQEEVKNDTLSRLCANLSHSFPEKSLILIVVSNNPLRQTDVSAKKLTEMQVEHSISWQHQTLAELVAQLRRFNKAVAEEPYKLQRTESLGGFKKYLANDKKQCVRVVGREGLKRLWQQHLNRLPGVTIHVTDAIMSAYPCPKKLLEAYEKDADKAPQLLSDLKIIRGGNGKPENSRRLGDAISSKFHKFYTSLDPDEVI